MRLLAVLALVLCTVLMTYAQPSHDQIRWENKTRKFIKFVPYDWDGEESLPLIINMHPFLTDGSFQMNYTRFNWLADTAKVIVVYPDGLNGSWNSGSWGEFDFGTDDVGFLDRLIDYMAIMYNIDTRRVYSTGYSAGGFMSYRLGCDLTNRIAAIAPVAAGMNPDLIEACNPDRPIPTMIFNGTKDALIPWEGFVGTAPVEDIVDFWTSFNGCDEPTVYEMPDIDPDDNTTTTRYSYNNCDNNAPVIFHKIHEGGHNWPGRNFPLLGNTAQDVIASEAMWEFFKQHKIPDDIACDKPSGLIVDHHEETINLSWDDIPGIDFYNLLYFHTDGDLQYVENIQDNLYEITNPGGGEVIWVVRSQCVSGHVSWSGIQHDAISGRMSGGRMAISAYPNPVSDVLTITLPVRTQISTYVIVDALGNTMQKGILEGQSDNISVRQLPAGLYHFLVDDHSLMGASFRKW